MTASHTGLDCTRTPIFRGGNDLTPKPGEVKLKGELVQPTRGVSRHTDAARVQRFGGAYRIKSIPAELEIAQQGRDPGHFELRPRAPMTPERFDELLKQVELQPSP
jgi:hypothetical protein